ncbi:DUF2884 family protein [Pseudoalteromonas luteoviolacea]|uniref:DUF2884 family protein n=1 Tax=Pseudoalteromonas luteoviolacea H33 TaxID=1365251 RepID=A0A161Y8K2_9GAMM|nr:DUF2884 family protein [Pseudoalteromonas luteoviolacea]KZN52270.1 hypothetical protein N476_11570 [Pseudoalteromonas luteoviolacea H33]KZN75771.1 hypothetical protein N477_17650 [Pseudoalteromonas luteoviolacea H33-S]MBQ4879190.1 YggN family protein [Pseudoalteromonas luteoviolacea]MBQ4908250.1 YggN family protein [Pseudoalteromonas luteoviolacea]
MKNTIISLAILSSTSVYAHNDHDFSITNDNCQVEFHNNVKITPQEVFITQSGNQQMMITANGTLYINDQDIQVTPEQQRALALYAETLRVELPKVADVATEAVGIASVALDEVATAFDLNSLDDLSGLLDELNDEVHNTFYQEGSFVMGEEVMSNFGEKFEHEFESRVESAVKSAMFESIGTLLMSIGSEMKQANGDFNTFEQRMEKLGESIEQRVTLQAEQLESRAESLCHQFEKIAIQEERLSQSIPTLSGYALMRYSAQ